MTLSKIYYNFSIKRRNRPTQKESNNIFMKLKRLSVLLASAVAATAPVAIIAASCSLFNTKPVDQRPNNPLQPQTPNNGTNSQLAAEKLLRNVPYI